MLVAASGVAWVSVSLSVVGIPIGLAGVYGWIVGTARKSIAETQRNAIDDLTKRVGQLEADVDTYKKLADEKETALKVLVAHVQGSDQLAGLTSQLTEAIKQGNDQYAVALEIMKNNHDDVISLLTRIEAKAS